MKIVKLDRWAMLLQEYDITFIHIRGKDNIIVDTICEGTNMVGGQYM